MTGQRPRGRGGRRVLGREQYRRNRDEHGSPPISPEPRLRSILSVHSVAGQVFFLLAAAAVLLIAAAVVALVLQAGHDSRNDATRRSIAAAQGFAAAPGTAAALTSAHPTAALQPHVVKAQKQSGVDFVVVMSPDGIRYASDDPALIGSRSFGDYQRAAAGKSLTRMARFQGVDYVRTLTPVRAADGSVVGVMSVGVRVQRVNDAVQRQLPVLLGSGAGALVLAAGGSALVGRRLLRQTHGLGPVEMTRMYEHHDAVLHAVREGVLIIGGDKRLLLANDEARRLLGLPPDAEGRRVADLGMEPGMTELLGSGRAATDEVRLAGDRLLAINTRPTDPKGGPPGSVATLRDTTELQALAGRAAVARERLTLLYEAGVRIGTTLDVVRTAEELAEVAISRFADVATVDLLEPVLRGEEPAGASTELHRAAVRSIRGEPPLHLVEELIRFAPSTPQASAVHNGRAVLEADLKSAPGWQLQDPERARSILEFGIHSLITVPLQARDVVLGMVNFWRADTPEPFGEEDVSFAEELTARAAVSIDNARRFTREHTTAVTLQRRLLPRALPEQPAVEVDHRYLPARAGVGGDWFDVLPLPGARVALVVGDVVGHGLHAAATMGRLRTAVHNFSTLDLPPDELLGHLDDLVTRIDADEAAESEEPSITGATCLYAIYDSVAGRCTVARAGHPGPALVLPDGTVDFPEVPASLPLGLGGEPFETVELQLTEGSQLVLFTDGLIEDRGRDIDVGLGLLRDALANHPGRGPHETCQAVFDVVFPACPRDDVALLVARTRLLDPARIAHWDVPSDPAAVAPVRAACGRQLQAWGLEEIAYTTGLILSELITNAIRYGTQPITVRLLYDRSLICEVSDGSSTSPHLRRAAATDEGGRGLFLIAQLAERWGTRYTSRGKVIWTEQALHDGGAEPSGDLGRILLDQWTDEAL
ncbi:SpoIIE family protein phosphatase [Streptomyces sp. 110]|uniref:SpoIIE family protein phosphatase n=1 Tax=Streptomyces endocoffeicus TaxID=2898945 RepID=A0ABS1Q8G8_9ACTN|nr:SpoIIE family protein phosphatase [Streptomyces endocoffeicus]